MGIPLLSTKLPLELLLTQWSTSLNQLLKNPVIQGYPIYSLVLTASTAQIIPISLGYVQQGWFLIDNMANCNVWRTEPFNAKTLTLEASADTTISIWVF